jgi:uncharacterized protein YeaO (DUF488 family)
MEGGMIQLRRVYDEAAGGNAKGEGTRFLVDRLWPRGIKKEALHFDAWLKDADPRPELRQWFAHDPAKWKEFQRRYFAELDKRPEALEPIRKALHHGQVTFLYSSHDAEHNNAVALKTYLARRKAR